MKLLILLFVVTAHSADPTEFSSQLRGTVTRVFDDGTIQLQRAGSKRQLRFMLAHIVLPRADLQQPHSRQSLMWLRRTIQGQPATIRYASKDGIVFAEVNVDNANVNRAALQGGYAWYRNEPFDSVDLENEQDAARLAKRGLWSEDNPIAPWTDPETIRAAVEDTRNRMRGDVFVSFAPLNRLLEICDSLLSAPASEDARKNIKALADQFLSGIDRSRRLGLVIDYDLGPLLIVPTSDAQTFLNALQLTGLKLATVGPNLYSANGFGAKQIDNYLLFCRSVDSARDLNINPSLALRSAGEQDDISISIPVTDTSIEQINWLLPLVQSYSQVHADSDALRVISFQSSRFVASLLDKLDQVAKLEMGISAAIPRQAIVLRVDAFADSNSELAQRVAGLERLVRIGPALDLPGQTFSLRLSTGIPDGESDPIRLYFQSNSALVQTLLTESFPDATEERIRHYLEVISLAKQATVLDAGIAWTGDNHRSGNMILFMHSDDPSRMQVAIAKLLAVTARETASRNRVLEKYEGFEIEQLLGAFEQQANANFPPADFLVARREGNCIIARGNDLLSHVKASIDSMGQPPRDHEILSAQIDLSDAIPPRGILPALGQHQLASPEIAVRITSLPQGLRLQLQTEKWMFQVLEYYLVAAVPDSITP